MKTMLRRGLIVWLAVAATAAVVALPAAALQSGDRIALADVVIGLQRTPCIGQCPSYELTIHGDGRVVYEGREGVARTGRIEARIDTTIVAGLVNRFLSVCFFELPSMCDASADVSLQDSGLMYSIYCPSRIERSTTLSLKLGDLDHTVVMRRYQSTDLARLAQAIDAAVNVERWTRECTGPALIESAPFACEAEVRDVSHGAGAIVEVVVLPDGSVAEADIVQSAESGFDACALDDARQLRFEPAMCKGDRGPARARVGYVRSRTGHGVKRVMLPEPLMESPLISSVAEVFRYEEQGVVAYPAYRYGGIRVSGDMPAAWFEFIQGRISRNLRPDQSIVEIVNYLTIRESVGSPAAFGARGRSTGHIAVRVCTANANWKCRSETIYWFGWMVDALVQEDEVVMINRD